MTAQPDMFGAPDVGGERHEDDAYYTAPWCTLALLDYLGDDLQGSIWEPFCGDGTGIVLPLRAAGHTVHASDISTRDDILSGAVRGLDFLSCGPEHPLCGVPNIVTNSAYAVTQNGEKRLASDFVRHALRMASCSVWFFLRNGWSEPCKDRYTLFRDHPPTDYVHLPRCNFVGAPPGNNQHSVWYGWRLDAPETRRVEHYPDDIREPTFDWSRLDEIRRPR